jgi:hypothetical protein
MPHKLGGRFWRAFERIQSIANDEFLQRYALWSSQYKECVKFNPLSEYRYHRKQLGTYRDLYTKNVGSATIACRFTIHATIRNPKCSACQQQYRQNQNAERNSKQCYFGYGGDIRQYNGLPILGRVCYIYKNEHRPCDNDNKSQVS